MHLSGQKRVALGMRKACIVGAIVCLGIGRFAIRPTTLRRLVASDEPDNITLWILGLLSGLMIGTFLLLSSVRILRSTPINLPYSVLWFILGFVLGAVGRQSSGDFGQANYLLSRTSSEIIYFVLLPSEGGGDA